MHWLSVVLQLARRGKCIDPSMYEVMMIFRYFILNLLSELKKKISSKLHLLYIVKLNRKSHVVVSVNKIFLSVYAAAENESLGREKIETFRNLLVSFLVSPSFTKDISL